MRIAPLRNALVASAIISGAWNLYQSFMPIYGTQQGLSATAFGLVLSAFAVSIILVRAVLPVALRRASAPQLLTYPGEREVAQLAADYVAAHPDEFPALHSTQNVEA